MYQRRCALDGYTELNLSPPAPGQHRKTGFSAGFVVGDAFATGALPGLGQSVVPQQVRKCQSMPEAGSSGPRFGDISNWDFAFLRKALAYRAGSIEPLPSSLLGWRSAEPCPHYQSIRFTPCQRFPHAFISRCI